MLSGAECSASNNQLSQFLKHAQTDRSLQQDTMQGPTGLASRPAFRTQPAGARGGAPEMEAFLRGRDPASTPFDMQSMRAEMEAVRDLGVPAPAGGAHAWAQELHRPAPHVGGAWSEQFHSMGAGVAPVRPTVHTQAPRPHEASFLRGPGAPMPGLRMGPHPLMPAGLEREQVPNRFVELDEAQWQAQFDRLEAEAADTKGKGKAAESSATEAQAPSQADTDALSEEAQLKELREMEARLRDEVHDENPRFEELWNALKDTSLLDKREDLAEWERQLMEAVADEDAASMMHPGGGLGYGEFGHNELDGLGEDEAALRRHLNDVDERGFPMLGSYEYESHNPYVSHAAPYAEGMRLVEQNGSLTDAALLFEAATLRDAAAQGEIELTHEERSRAWQKLGECHAMNEHETKAIQALEEAVRLDAGNVGALMSLAVSYINEGYDQAANETLLRYLARSHPHMASSSEFPTLPDEQRNPWARLDYVRGLYLKAVREDAAEQRLDPDLQIGLGLLFYASSSYEQARDCFRAALSVRPDDWQLWNRLGATLANGGNPELATEAYHKALELRPTFTRAIYNLSVSCLNLGAHHEAAEHLLSALALQRTQTLPDTPGSVPTPMLAHVQESQGLWNTLRSVMVMLNQFDLANKCQVGTDLEEFRSAGFEF